MESPETSYAWNGSIALAYQVIGEGPIDLLYLQGRCSHVDMNWESPYLAGLLRALARHARVIITDRRGFGCSDRFSPTDIPPFEVFTDDILLVLDAVGSDRAAIFGTWDCALIATLWAAAYPERAAALILADAFITYAATPETPWMPTAEQWEERLGTPGSPGGHFSGDELLVNGREQKWFQRYLRASVGPGAHVAEIRRYLATDVRTVLSSVHVPTLILQDAHGTRVTSPEAGRYLRDHIAGARLVELDGNDQHHWYWGSDSIAGSVETFLAEVRGEEADFDRVLATVLFTDIVGSTEKAAEMGDRRWRELVQAHHANVRALLARYRGKEVGHRRRRLLRNLRRGPFALCGVQGRSPTPCTRSASRSAPAYTRANVKSSTTRWADWPSASVPGYAGWPGPRRFWHPRRLLTSLPARACDSRTGGLTNARESQGTGGSSPWNRRRGSVRYMVIESYTRGRDPVYARAAERGRMLPPGLVYLESWIGERGLDRCFQLMETEDPSLFDQWTAYWNDLVEFEIVPVVSSTEAAARLAG